MTIHFNEITEFNRAVFRNIQGNLAEQDEFDDLTTSTSAKKFAHRSAANSALHFDELNYHAIDFVFNQTNWLSSRFCNGTYPVWYGSVTLNTSFYETSYHWRKIFLEAPQGFQQAAGQVIMTSRRVFTVTCQAALIDLRNKVKQHAELIHPNTSHYVSTQAIGQRIYQQGYPGLITKSARHYEGENVVVFRRKILSDAKLFQDYIYEYDLRENKTRVKNSQSNDVVLTL
jgi:hypothetical protein